MREPDTCAKDWVTSPVFEVVYEDISEQHISPGANHSGKSDDKDDDYAFPVDAVNEDTEPIIYENPIHPIEQAHPQAQSSVSGPKDCNSNSRYGGDGDRNSGSDNVIRT